MVALKKYDLSGKELEEIVIKDDLLKADVRAQSIKDYIVAIRNNARQWSANTKGRKEVNKTGKKPPPQKGLGSARQGCFAAPQYKGGGVVFGPKPKINVHIRVNKKERRNAIRSLIAAKIKENRVILLSSDPVSKTKEVVKFLSAVGYKDRKTLFLGKQEEKEYNQNFIRCMRNISKANFCLLKNVNGYDLACNESLVVMDLAYEELMVVLAKASE